MLTGLFLGLLACPPGQVIDLDLNQWKTQTRSIKGNAAIKAKSAGKVAKDFAIDPAWRDNTPETLAQWLAPHDLPDFPFGTDFDAVANGCVSICCVMLLPTNENRTVESSNGLHDPGP